MFTAELLEIKDKLALVKRLDKRFQVFGASQHRYFSYVPSEAEIKMFERSLSAKLPASFRKFIKTIGYGAGPYEGIWSFEKIINEHDYFLTKGHIKPSLAFPFSDLVQAKKVAKTYQQVIQAPSDLTASFPSNGCIALQGSRSCDRVLGSWIVLALNGELAGTVWFVGEVGSWHPSLRPIGISRSGKILPNVDAPLLFHEWYLSWLEQCIADLS